MRNGHVHEKEMSRMPVKEMLSCRHEARVRSPRNPVRDKEEREESSERKRQATC